MLVVFFNVLVWWWRFRTTTETAKNDDWQSYSNTSGSRKPNETIGKPCTKTRRVKCYLHNSELTCMNYRFSVKKILVAIWDVLFVFTFLPFLTLWRFSYSTPICQNSDCEIINLFLPTCVLPKCFFFCLEKKVALFFSVFFFNFKFS